MCINLDFLLNGQFVVYCYQCILLFYSNHGSICSIKVQGNWFDKKKISVKTKKKLVQNDNGTLYIFFCLCKFEKCDQVKYPRKQSSACCSCLIESRVLYL